ncbi:MAG TPA: sigma-70 family RNA polymerase sigma factor [Gemmataceae bacterium]|nr:sigma-70 family RNA polymerase sigma factor [Gemmataceae bacterium]
MSERLEEHLPGVYRFALRLTGNPHAAEDLTQEAFLRAWRQARQLRVPQAARAWLLRITMNVWRDQMRRGQSPVARAGPLGDYRSHREQQPDQQVAGQENIQRVLQALQSLPERQRQVLQLSVCDDLSAAEIADVLGTSSDAVKASLCVARKKLREQLHDLVDAPLPVADKQP